MANPVARNKIVAPQVSQQDVSKPDSAIKQASNTAKTLPSGSVPIVIVNNKHNVLACTPSHPRGYSFWKQDAVEDVKRQIQRKSYEKSGCEETLGKSFDQAVASDARYIEDADGYTIGVLLLEATENSIELAMEKCDGPVLQQPEVSIYDPAFLEQSVDNSEN